MVNCEKCVSVFLFYKYDDVHWNFNAFDNVWDLYLLGMECFLVIPNNSKINVMNIIKGDNNWLINQKN